MQLYKSLIYLVLKCSDRAKSVSLNSTQNCAVRSRLNTYCSTWDPFETPSCIMELSSAFSWKAALEKVLTLCEWSKLDVCNGSESTKTNSTANVIAKICHLVLPIYDPYAPHFRHKNIRQNGRPLVLLQQTLCQHSEIAGRQIVKLMA